MEKVLSKSPRPLSPETQTIEDAVTALLAEAKVTVTTTYAGEVNKPDWNLGKKHMMDHWRVSFTKVAVQDPYSVDYYTGLGNRQSPHLLADSCPVMPTPSSVLHSLCMDATCVDEYTFRQFAEEMSLSDDSIKARDMYIACQDTRTELLRLFSPEIFDKLCETVREY